MSIQPTKIVNAPAMLLAGIEKHFSMQTMGEIPGLWGAFVPYLGRIPGQVAPVSYGVCSEMNESGFQYMACVEVSADGDFPEGFTTKQLPAQRYAVFVHEGHVSNLPTTIDAIWHQWLPESGEAVADSPLMFERYGEKFDPQAMQGDLEVWIAIKS